MCGRARGRRAPRGSAHAPVRPRDAAIVVPRARTPARCRRRATPGSWHPVGGGAAGRKGCRGGHAWCGRPPSSRRTGIKRRSNNDPERLRATTGRDGEYHQGATANAGGPSGLLVMVLAGPRRARPVEHRIEQAGRIGPPFAIDRDHGSASGKPRRGRQTAGAGDTLVRRRIGQEQPDWASHG